MKKFLSFILVMAMVLSVSGMAMAAGATAKDASELIQAVNDNDDVTITLTDNIVLSGTLTIPAGKTVTLNLGGFTLSFITDLEITTALIENKGTLIIEGPGTISNTANNPDTDWNPEGFPTYANNTIKNLGKLTVNGGTIENKSPAGGACYAIDNYTGGDVVINGGKVISENDCAIRQFVNGDNNSVTINGGTIQGKRAVWVQLAGSSASNKRVSSLTVTGGTLTATKESEGLAIYTYSFGDSFDNTSVTISGGTFNGAVGLMGGAKEGTPTVSISGGSMTNVEDYSKKLEDIISGGTFTEPPAEELLAAGMGLNAGSDGKIEVGTPEFVAEVNGTQYTDIQEAIKAAAQIDGTVELLRDVVVPEWIMFSETLSISSGEIITINPINVTINGNNKTLTIYSIESAGNGNRLFYDATKLNIKDLTIKYADGVGGGIGLTSGKIENVTIEGGNGIYPGNGDITIEGCTFKTNGAAIYNEEDRDNLVVTGNTFDTADGAYAIYLRGNTTFTDNTVITGKVNATKTASGEISGNNFGTERFKVYNEATATISNNTINNLVFNDETEPAATFENNIMSEEAEAALDAVTPSYTITVVASPTDAGTVTGGGNYKKGKPVTVTATANEGYRFVAWTENGDEVSDKAAYTFTAEADRDLVAVFEEVVVPSYTVTVSASPSEGGVVAGGGSYEEDEEATVTAVANDGYTFKVWVDENGDPVSTEAEYTFTVTEDCELVAVFEEVEEEPEDPKPTKPDRKDIKVKYEGGNRFSTNKSAVPTSVEIDGVPVSFVGDGRSFTVSCIEPGNHWITVRWHSTSVTTNFTADASVVCIPNAIPKTGDMPIWAAIAEFLGF